MPVLCRSNSRAYRASRPGAVRVLAVLAVLAFAWPLSGQDRSEATVKAAYVFNLIRLIEWPPSAAPGVPDFTIAVLGRGPMLSALSADIGKPVKGRRLVVREISSIDELGSAQVVFVGAAASDYAGTVARAAAPRGALTVSEIDIAEAPDTVVNLAVEDGRVVFDVNRDVAERSGLQLGARLLKAARAVYGRGRGQP